MTELIEVARELYALPLAEFTAARNDRAKRLRGDGKLVAAVKKLPKPSVSAWVVNLMSRELGDQLDQLLDLGATIREAQAAGADLRDLDQQRRRLVGALARQGGALAEEHGQRVSDSALEEVEGTVHAAMLDSDAEAALRSGVLAKPMVATGFGSVDVSGVVAVEGAADLAPPPRAGRRDRRLAVAPEPKGSRRRPRAAEVDEEATQEVAARPDDGPAGASGTAQAEKVAAPARRRAPAQPEPPTAEEPPEPEPATAEDRRTQRRREREARRARADAQARVELRRAEADDAAQELADAEQRLHDLEARALQIQAEVDELERRLAELRHELESVEDERDDARQDVDDAREAREDADQALAEAQEALDRLE